MILFQASLTNNKQINATPKDIETGKMISNLNLVYIYIYIYI